MKRRSTAAGKADKAGRREASTPKRAGTAKSAFKGRANAASPSTEIARLARERDEALEREKATADVLRVISSSPGELQPVFTAILDNATRICEANFGTLFLRNRDVFRFAAEIGTPPALAQHNRQLGQVTPTAGGGLEKVLRTKQVTHIVDAASEVVPSISARLGGARSTVYVPMLQDDQLIGVIIIYRQEVRPFTDKQIELVQNFAAQAVIAIENTRLLNELRQRTDDLTQSLEQQTATADVLQVISSSPGDLAPVFEAMLKNATRICEAKFGTLYRFENAKFEVATVFGSTPEVTEAQKRRGAFTPTAGTLLDRLMRTKEVAHTADYALEAAQSLPARLGGARSTVAVPMLKEGLLIGAFAIYRQEPRPFTDKQIELLRNFAAQAVIAIENARLLNELRESLEQQTATADVLQVISSSPGALDPVFQTILDNATRICEARFGVLTLSDGDAFRVVSMHNAPAAYAELRRREPVMRPSGSLALTQAVASRRAVQIADATDDPANRNDPIRRSFIAATGARSFIVVPMLKERDVIGAINVYRTEVRPFSDKQIALLSNFAAQAVIAIENARLLSELRQRTEDLSESLEQQTATSEVLKVISSSPGDLQPVFSTMLESAAHLCDASFGNIFRWDDDVLRLVATYNTPPAFAEARIQLPLDPRQDNPIADMLTAKTVLHVDDLTADERYTNRRDTNIIAAVELGGVRTFLAVPMLRDNELIGALILYRQEVCPFSDKQIELVKNFAAQAVIAIENARLLNELHQRTADLSEALKQQTATSEVLKVISSAQGDLQSVFDAILENATRICEANFGNLTLYDGGVFRRVALCNGPPAWTADQQREPRRTREQAPLLYRLADTKAVVHVADVITEVPNETINKFTGARSLLIVPMLRGDELVGGVGIYRQEVRPFSDEQIALLKSFAAQAVIAIENARLLNELRESLEQQTATAEVLQVISGSLGELQPVFQAMLQNATRICEANFGTLYLREGDGVRLVAAYNVPPAFAEARAQGPIYPAFESALGQALRTKQTAHVADVAATQSYLKRHPVTVQAVEVGGVRTTVSVPLLKDNELVGLIGIYRQEVRPFTEKQVGLLTSFAAQAVIAIENTRLLNELQQRTEDLSKSLHDLQTAQDRLVQTQKLASLGQLTAGIAHEIKNPLNFVNNFSELSMELIDELQEAVGSIKGDDKIVREITELANTLHENLNKIGQHGKRADSIVKNMLLHSREGSGEQRKVDINALVEESLNLAYHGARAEKQSFNVTLERSFDPEAGDAELYPQEISRALLNFISNGFYAATKRSAEAGSDDNEPLLVATTRNLGNSVEIRIRDNGTGIPREVREKIFNPFFTTKPAGEGTGLGLSICHDIIVKQHAGSIEVDSTPGEFTEIRIVLPRAAPASIKT